MDTRRIVDFRLKAWAERFIILRAKLYSDDEGDDSNNGGSETSNEGNTSIPEGEIVSSEASHILEPRMGQLTLLGLIHQSK